VAGVPWCVLESARQPSVSEVLCGACFQASCSNELCIERGCQRFALQGNLQEGEIRDCS
jgi:hypothetical protein